MFRVGVDVTLGLVEAVQVVLGVRVGEELGLVVGVPV